jgi:integrase
MSFAERDSRTKKHTGRWAIDFWYKAPGEPDRRIRGAWATKATADANEAYARVTGMLPPDPNAEQPCGPTFAQAAKDMRTQHSPWQRGRDPSGQKRLDWAVDHIGNLPVSQVSTEDIDRMVSDLKRRPVSSKRNKTGTMTGRTLNGYLTMVSAVLTWAAARPKAYGKFVPPVIPWQDTIETRIHFMTNEQQTLLVNHYLGQGWHEEALLVRTLCASGMRWGELAGLEAHMLQVTKLATGQEIGWIKLDRTKTDNPRDIPLPPKMVGELRALFGNGYSTNYHRSRSRFDAAKNVLGLPPALTLYGARHAAATYLTKRGMQPAKIQQFMGHKSYSTTQKYVNVENEDLAEAANFLTPTLGGESENAASANVVALNKVG